MDIVYPLKNCDICEELIYSLRSLENVPHDKVFIVGGCPKCVNKEKVAHIPVLQGSNRYQNTTLSLIAACDDSRISDDFILFNDDFFVLEKIENPVQELNLNMGSLYAQAERLIKKNNTYYGESLFKTAEFLSKKCGIKEPLSYELHTPFIFNKAKLKEIFCLDEFLENAALSVGKRSIYGNLFCKNSKQISDVKVLNKSREIYTDKFLSCSDKGFALIKDFLAKKFKTKSIYEV